MDVINIKKANLKVIGYQDLQDWCKDENNLYIGRHNHYVGAKASKWKNPFTVKKYGIEDCLKRYEEHVRGTSLYNELEELRGKTLGCWCKPERCHGDVLVKLLNEKDEKAKK